MENSDNSFEMIRKSRELYFKKGSLRRYCLREEIANSWIKYNLLKNQDIELTNNYTKKGKALKLISEPVSKFLEDNNFKVHIILDKDHIYDFAFKKTKEYYSTGAEIAFKLKKDFTVFKAEHISNKFDDSFTHGFFIKAEGSVEYVLGVYGKYEDYSEDKIDHIKRLIYKDFEERKKNKNQRNFIGCEKKYNCISHHYLPVLLIGAKGTGRNHFVQWVHENLYPKEQLKIISCKNIIDINKYFKIKSKTILYLKDVEWLTYKNQLKLASYIDSKLVNSNRDKSSDSNNMRIFISSNEEAIKSGRKEWLDHRLLTRLTANHIHFDLVNAYDEQLIFQIIENETNRVLTDESKAIIKEFSWENNWNDCIKLIDYIREHSTKLEIEIIDLPKFLTDRTPEITTIKEAEKDLIRRSIKVFDENISLAAQALGISRSTLYRKIKEYKIF